MPPVEGVALLDLEVAASRLTDVHQRQLVMAAVALTYAADGANLSMQDRPHFHNVYSQAIDAMARLVAIVPGSGLTTLPDLNQLGIRMCTSCGCTDGDCTEEADGGCHWVSKSTCSACAPPLLERDAAALRRG